MEKSDPPEIEKQTRTEPTELPSILVTRRKFLRLAGLISAGVGVTAAVEACALKPNQESEENFPVAIPDTGLYTEVPQPSMVPPPDTLAFLTPDEARLLDAITSRLIPGSADDPGAHEADVVNFIDKKLAYRNGTTEPTYSKGPFAKAYEGDQPPQGAGAAKDVVYVKKSELERYGAQSKLNPQQTYRMGLADLQKYANQKYGGNYETLSSDQQDEILEDMEDDKVTGFSEPSAKGLFKAIYDDTTNGFLSDPGYGGNKDMVGWKLLKYPGAQRAYTPVDMHDEQQIRPPQSLAMLMNFHAGMPSNPDVIVPPAGSSAGGNQ